MQWRVAFVTFLFTRDPLSINNFAVSVALLQVALCNGVSPSSSIALILAPLLINRFDCYYIIV